MQQLEYLSSNRELLRELKASKRLNYFLVNIDNFSNINDAYGFEVGDRVLEELSRFLNMIKPRDAKVYRFCSDKFVLLDSRELSKEEIVKIAEEILSFFSQVEIEVEDITLKISLSIGISIDKGLINIIQAEVAMKELRESNRNHYKIFNPLSDFVHKQQQNIYWIHKIKEAVSDESIVAYFQPIVNNNTNKIEKYECLARLKDDDEIISPYLFMEAAKVTGNLPYVTRSLIGQSFKKFAGTDYDFSLNITSEDLTLEYLEELLLKNVSKYNIDPSRVTLEMLENITTLDEGTIMTQLMSLRMNGFKIAIDDFGSANSNLSRLLEIEPDYLKIDGSFIKDIITDKKSQIIVDAIISICKSSGIQIIAEYVHNKEVQEEIKWLGIEYSQGFYFGEPQPDLIELSVDV